MQANKLQRPNTMAKMPSSKPLKLRQADTLKRVLDF
jgi:hypothetical protein